MASGKITTMILNVRLDLKCSCCYNKLRKLLCGFPQIRDQVFDEDKNKVTITVVCCDPEKIRENLCCKGGETIHSIEIVENPENTQKTNDDTTQDEKEKTKIKETKKKNHPRILVCCQECSEGRPGGPCHRGNGRHVTPLILVPVCYKECSVGRGGGPCHYGNGKPVPSLTGQRLPVCCQGCSEGRGGGPCHHKNGRPAPPPSVRPVSVSVCCQECSEGRSGGPCHHGNGRPVRAPPVSVSVCCQECSEGRGGGPCHYEYGRPVPPPPGPCYEGYSCGYDYPYGNRPRRCDYFSEENPQGCSIM